MIRLRGSTSVELVLHKLTGLLLVVSILVLLYHAKDLVDIATSLKTAQLLVFFVQNLDLDAEEEIRENPLLDLLGNISVIFVIKDLMPLLSPNNESFAHSMSFVYELTLVIECAAIVSNCDSTTLSEDKKLFPVDLKSNIDFPLVEECYLGEIVKFIKKDCF